MFRTTNLELTDEEKSKISTINYNQDLFLLNKYILDLCYAAYYLGFQDGKSFELYAEWTTASDINEEIEKRRTLALEKIK